MLFSLAVCRVSNTARIVVAPSKFFWSRNNCGIGHISGPVLILNGYYSQICQAAVERSLPPKAAYHKHSLHRYSLIHLRYYVVGKFVGQSEQVR